jgi:hypothetical protein
MEFWTLATNDTPLTTPTIEQIPPLKRFQTFKLLRYEV